MADDKELASNIEFPQLDELSEDDIKEYEESASSGGGRTLTDAERSSGKESDFKAALRTIVPDWTDDDIEELKPLCKSLMITNISWEAVIPQMTLTVNSIILRHARDGIDNKKAPVNVMVIYNTIHSFFYPAIQGKRTVDILELFGATSGGNDEETKEHAKALGF